MHTNLYIVERVKAYPYYKIKLNTAILIVWSVKKVIFKITKKMVSLLKELEQIEK
jgi:hypothetical protein